MLLRVRLWWRMNSSSQNDLVVPVSYRASVRSPSTSSGSQSLQLSTFPSLFISSHLLASTSKDLFFTFFFLVLFLLVSPCCATCASVFSSSLLSFGSSCALSVASSGSSLFISALGSLFLLVSSQVSSPVVSSTVSPSTALSPVLFSVFSPLQSSFSAAPFSQNKFKSATI